MEVLMFIGGSGSTLVIFEQRFEENQGVSQNDNSFRVFQAGIAACCRALVQEFARALYANAWRPAGGDNTGELGKS